MKAALNSFLALAFVTPALAAPDMYLAWATSKWGTAATGSVVQRSVTWGEEADPDRDGIANLIEYACDTDPTRHNPASDCWQFFLPDSGAAEYRYPQITAHLRTDDPDLRVLAQTSQDLAFWSPQASSVDFSQPQPENPAVWEQATGSTLRGLRQMRYIDRLSMAQRSRAFMRLHVVRRFASASTTPIEPFAFTPGQTVATGSTARSSSITLAGFAGTLSASIPAGATLFVNGTAQTGSSATVKAGDVLWMQAAAPGIAGQPGNYTLTIGGQSATWSFTAGSIAAVPDHPGTDSGYTPVETGVSDTGAAQISIPIVVAPGTAGMQPKLSINYSSQGGNGPLGVGFSLSGLSAISRVGRTVAQDGVKGGVNFDANDRFALDGQRLVLVSGTWGVAGSEYRTEVESFSQITAIGQQGNAPSKWLVKTKAGLTYEYGGVQNAKVDAARFVGDVELLTWLLVRVTDTMGNAMEFTYTTPTAPESGYRNIQSIVYTSNTSASPPLVASSTVLFEYEDRPDVRISYIGGAKVEIRKRLIGIEAQNNGNALRRYELDYQLSPDSAQSQLVQVREKGVEPASGPWPGLPPTVITWQTNGTPFTFSAPLATGLGSSLSAFVEDLSGDFNGDGLADVLIYDSATLKFDLYLNQGGGTFGARIATDLSTPDADLGSLTRLFLLDANGDGMTDVMSHQRDTSYFLYLANGSGFTLSPEVAIPFDYPASQSRPVVTGDFNGDGRTDFMVWRTIPSESASPAYYPYYVTSSGGTFTRITGVSLPSHNSTTVIPQQIVGDFNSDGMADLLNYHVPFSNSLFNLFPSTGLGFGVATATTVPGWSNSSILHLPGDYNGDGLVDLGVFNNSTGKYDIHLCKGSGFAAPLASNVTPNTSANLLRQTVADFNGDGLSDMMMWNATSSRYDIYRAKGDGTFAAPVQSDIPSQTNQGSRNILGDFNGDGRTDVLVWRQPFDINRYFLYLSAGKQPDLVTKVTNGQGGWSQLDYKPLTDASVYTKGAALAYPFYTIQAPMHAVAQMQTRNGVDGDAFTAVSNPPVTTSSTSYHYEQGWMSLDGQGFRGFTVVEQTDDTTGIVTRSEYDNTRPQVAGRPLRTTQKLADGRLISETLNTWVFDEYPFTNGAHTEKSYFTFSSESITRSFEVNAPVGSAPVRTSTVNNVDYDSFGNLLTSTTTQGDFSETVVSTYTNDTTRWILGRLATSSVTKIGPNPAGAGTVSLTRSSSFAYHPTTGLLTQEVIEPSGGVLRQQKDYTHDGFGNILTSTISTSGAASRTTTTTYTPDGRFVATTTNAEGHTESKTYDPLLGNVLTQTGPNGLTTSWEYDAIGRPVKETRPDGTVTRSFYRRVTGSTGGAPPRAVHYVRVQSSGSAPKTVWYDLLDREVKTDGIAFDGRTVSAHKVFNNRGEVTHASQPYFAGDTPLYSTMLYDAVGREYQQTDPGNRVTKTTYDGLTTTVERNYNPAALTDFQKAVTVVNAMGWTVQSSQYLGTAAKTITRKYDPYGNLRFVTDPAGNTTELRYDVRGNKTWMSEPNSGISTFTYHGFGELKTQTNAANQTTTLAYDRLGRVTSRMEPEGVTTFTYDTASQGIGQLAREAGPGFERRYFYDALARPAATAETHGFHVFSTSRGYDLYSRPESVTYPSGFATRQVYNASGHLSEVQNGANSSTLYWRALQVNARGQVTQEALGNGIVTDRAFEAETGLIQGITSTLNSSVIVQHLSFTFDLLGNLTERRDKRFSTHFVEGFGYDTLNRLQSVSTTGAAAVTCAYNDLGNLTSRSDVGTLNYASSGAGPHALTSVTGSSGGALNKTCGYDVKGNRTTDGGTVLDYSSFNKPTRIRKGGDTLSFDYGPDRALYRQTIFHTDGSGAASQTVREYIGGLYEREITSEGLVRHIHHIAGGNGVVAIHTDERSAASAAQRTRFIHKDHLGSVDAITDSNGVVVERQSYDAWGRRRTVTHNAGTWTVTYPATPGSAETHRGFTGHEMLDLVGLVHMGGRIYDPITARFLSPDPFVQSPDNLQNLNRYSYVLNNPLSFTDPSGFFFKGIGKFLVKAVKTFIAHAVGTVVGTVVGTAAFLATGNPIAFAIGFKTGYGFGSAFSGTLLAGGSVGDALRAGLNGARVGFASGVIDAALPAPIAFGAKAVVHGVNSEAHGRSFKHGFFGYIRTSATTYAKQTAFDAFKNWAETELAVTQTNCVGGTSSPVGGGKFANGASTKSFALSLANKGSEVTQSKTERAEDVFGTIGVVSDGTEYGFEKLGKYAKNDILKGVSEVQAGAVGGVGKLFGAASTAIDIGQAIEAPSFRTIGEAYISSVSNLGWGGAALGAGYDLVNDNVDVIHNFGADVFGDELWFDAMADLGRRYGIEQR